MNFLAPIEYILLKVFETSYAVTNNYGIALILMSITVTLGTYPLYYLADIWKKKEDTIQFEMKKEIDDIKRVFKGQKQFYLIQTTYRFHNYKSWYSLRAALGLLIQIPFFFAAYNVLSSYQGYINHSFLCFSDLSKPDSILFGINLLPIIMTVVNLISSIVYTRSFSIKDNKQLTILALLFFVFLYNSPSALLIYWTNNNILSLIKSYFLNRQKIIKYPSDSDKKDLKLVFIASILYTLFLFSQFIINQYIEPKYILLLFFIWNFFFIPFCYLKRNKNPIVALRLFLKENYLLCLILGIFIPIYVLKPHISIINIKPLDALVLFISLFLLTCKQVIKLLNLEAKKISVESKKNLFISFILFFLVISIVMPLKTYLSSPDEIGCNYSRILIVGITILILLSFLAYFFLKFGNVFTYICGIFLIVVSILNMLFPINVGVISGFGLTLDKVFTYVSFEYFCRDVFIGFIAIIISYVIHKKNIAYVKYFTLIILCVTLVQIFLKKSNYISPQSYKQKENVTKLPEKYYQMHNLSSTKPNILYICLDMFNSEYIPLLQKDIENFDEEFRGFTFYKDCLSISGWTHTSFGGALYYGNDYSPINNNNNKVSLQEAGEEAMKKLNKLLEKNNYSSNYINDVILRENPLQNTSVYDIANYYCYKNNESLSSISKLKLLEMLSLFQIVPTVIKRYIYDESKWIIYGEPAAIEWTRDYVLKSISYLSLLPEMSSNTAEKSTFLSIRTDLPHDPYGITSDGNLIKDNYPDQNQKSFYTAKAAYYSAKKTIELLLLYFDWMKQNNVWDNTVIVLFSDHGNNYHDNNIPTKKNISEEEAGYFSRSNALYLIKPINCKNDFKIDSTTYKSNGDILYDVFKSLDIENDIKPCTIDGIRYYSYMKSMEDRINNKSVVDYASYKVDGSIFSQDSWTRIE